MSDNTAIEWADATWNPLRGTDPNRWMCAKISPGCDNCYASTFNRRMGGQVYPAVGDPAGFDLLRNVTLAPDRIMVKPHEWARPRRIFVASMTDLFGEWVTFEMLDEIFAVMHVVDRHRYMVLTKRPRRMLDYIEHRRQRAAETGMPLCWPIWPEQIWAGVTVEQDRYAWRADLLRAVPAAVRFVSAEPLLSDLPSLDLRGIQWLIVGGESGGPAERRLYSSSERDLSWVRGLRDRAQAEGVAFHFKQWGGARPKSQGRLLDGQRWDQFPEPSIEGGQR